jgi:3',5'-cyclic AMP phosphodiesterase CpdA
MSQPAAGTVRLAHFSDVHITSRPLGWGFADWFNKRWAGWFNLRFLGRAYRFRDADALLGRLMTELRQDPPDHLIFSGDATTLGFEQELRRAVELLGVNGAETPPGLAVPGNHDYYTRSVAASGLFERYFAPWQKGLRVYDAPYPFAQRLGPVWLIGVNSCTGNRLIVDASGQVGTPQLKRLETLFQQLDDAPRILVTHYPICLKSGHTEHRYHGLRDLDAVLSVAERGGVALWLHGHRHGPYHFAQTQWASFPVICTGSVTQHGCWSYGFYTIEGNQVRAIRRTFSEDKQCFEESERFDLELRRASKR